MPPARSRPPPPDDSRSEASSTKEKAGTNSTNNNVNGKNRRVGATANATTTAATTASSLRDVVTAEPSVPGPSTAVVEVNPGIQWSTLDPEILHGYRHDYRLNTPASFNKQSNQLILSRSPIGRMSPTMVGRRKEERKQSKEQLANSVRKHFNSMAIVENEVVVDFLYKVRWQDKNFRMRFAPQRPR